MNDTPLNTPQLSRRNLLKVGLLGTALASSTALSQLSWGFVAYGLGMLGLLKTAIEMRERHRLDKRAIAGAATDMEESA